MIREDRTKLDRLVRFLNRGSTIKVGILEKGVDTHEDSGLTIGALAAIHEFGLGQEERSFVRGWYDARRDDLVKQAIDRFRAAFAKGSDMSIVAEQLATKFASDCKNRMVSGWSYPDISEETKRRKGSDTPLIDTGVLMSSIMGSAQTI